MGSPSARGHVNPFVKGLSVLASTFMMVSLSTVTFSQQASGQSRAHMVFIFFKGTPEHKVQYRMIKMSIPDYLQFDVNFQSTLTRNYIKRVTEKVL